MLEKIRQTITHRRSLKQVARLDGHLKDDIGLGCIDDPALREPILMLTRGPFDRYSA